MDLGTKYERLVIIFGNAVKFSGEDGDLITSAKVWSIDPIHCQHTDYSTSAGYPIVQNTVDYDLYTTAYTGAGIYDAIYSFSYNRKMEKRFKLESLERVGDVDLDFLFRN